MLIYVFIVGNHENPLPSGNRLADSVPRHESGLYHNLIIISKLIFYHSYNKFFFHSYAYNVHLSNIISILRLIILVIQSFLLDVEYEIDIVRINVERLSDSVASVLSTDTRRIRHKHLPLYIFLIHFLIKITNLLPNNTRGVLLGRRYIFFL